MNVKKIISDVLVEIKTEEQFNNLVYAIANKAPTYDYYMEYAQLLYTLAYEIMGASGFWMDIAYYSGGDDTDQPNIMLYVVANLPDDKIDKDYRMLDFTFDLAVDTKIVLKPYMFKGIINEKEGKWSYSSTDPIELSAFAEDLDDALFTKGNEIRNIYLKELLKTPFAKGIEDILQKIVNGTSDITTDMVF